MSKGSDFATASFDAISQFLSKGFQAFKQDPLGLIHSSLQETVNLFADPIDGSTKDSLSDEKITDSLDILNSMTEFDPNKIQQAFSTPSLTGYDILEIIKQYPFQDIVIGGYNDGKILDDPSNYTTTVNEQVKHWGILDMLSYYKGTNDIIQQVNAIISSKAIMI